jgi:hypothetical protein
MSMRFKVVSLCKKDAMSAVPQEVVRYDLEKSAEVLRSRGFEVRDPGVMVRASRGGIETILCKNGRIMVSPAESKEVVRAIAEEFYAIVESARERP